ncbi:MAG: flagellar motor switch protein FliM [Rhodocyclales bacterium]|nr:flagellar motor switch protein FliM [Rhodocyclales bacterium]
MAQDFLSQEEVDALLKGVSGETDEAPVESGESGLVRPYDLGRQERIVRGRMPTMELINERFARYLRIGLFNYMHKGVEVSVAPIKVQKYSEFIRNLVVPTNLNLIQAKPLRGTGLVVLDPSLVFLVVDNMFGGDGRFHTRVEGRDFTPTEQRIIRGLLGVVFEEYQRAWQPVYPLLFEYVRSEMNTQFANIATPSEVVIAMSFTLEFSGNSPELHICLPYSMIEPIRDLLHSAMHSEQASADNRWTTMLTRELQTAEVELVATLASASLTVADVVNLQVGDVVPIEIQETATTSVDGVPIMASRYGIQNGQYALKIERFLAEDES